MFDNVYKKYYFLVAIYLISLIISKELSEAIINCTILMLFAQSLDDKH
jgi:hypothetical protein